MCDGANMLAREGINQARCARETRGTAIQLHSKGAVRKIGICDHCTGGGRNNSIFVKGRRDQFSPVMGFIDNVDPLRKILLSQWSPVAIEQAVEDMADTGNGWST
jgi:hypothetical protein